MKIQNRAAWIVEWHCPLNDPRIKDNELRPYMLPYRWNDRKVFDFMRCLFWNSGMFYPSETLCGVNKPGLRIVDPSTGYMMNYGALLSYGIHGDAFLLIAGFTQNLRITRDETGRFFVKWTRPSGSRRDDTTGCIVPCGSPVERKWSLAEGCWSCDSEP